MVDRPRGTVVTPSGVVGAHRGTRLRRRRTAANATPQARGRSRESDHVPPDADPHVPLPMRMRIGNRVVRKNFLALRLSKS